MARWATLLLLATDAHIIVHFHAAMWQRSQVVLHWPDRRACCDTSSRLPCRKAAWESQTDTDMSALLQLVRSGFAVC